jgi:hypothetical protein
MKQLDLFNDTDSNLTIEDDDILHIWYTSRHDDEYPDLICDIYSVDGYGEIGFYVQNGCWDGTLYMYARRIQVHATQKVIKVHKYEIVKSKLKAGQKEKSKIDDFFDDDIPF